MTQASDQQGKVVLISGCSSGIGRATAALLVADGHVVCATARREESVNELSEWAAASPGVAVVRRLDVTDQRNVQSVTDDLIDRYGRIDCLINNAGYGQFGTVEEVSPAAWRRQFETNVIGPVALTQAVLANMRSRRCGRIINVSSLAAHATLPLMGPYAASKFALDALSGSLRMEVAPYGIDVVLIEPGAVSSRFRDNVAANLSGATAAPQGPYARLYRALDDYWRGAFGRTGKTADDVARVIRKAVHARRPRARYRITAAAKILPWILPFVPDRISDAALLRRMGWNEDTAGGTE